VPESMTRADHIRWCKMRAREYLRVGDTQNAVTSMLSDLGKHPETRELQDAMGLIGIYTIQRGPEEAARFIEGFAE
jgi:hypothetical protein